MCISTLTFKTSDYDFCWRFSFTVPHEFLTGNHPNVVLLSAVFLLPVPGDGELKI